MFLHLGNETVVRIRDIVGIFDIDTCSTGKITREFLGSAERELLITGVSQDLPKSFVVTSDDTEKRIYISQISSSTLQRRIFDGKNSRVSTRKNAKAGHRFGKGENT
jgi:hypothetical protein